MGGSTYFLLVRLFLLAYLLTHLPTLHFICHSLPFFLLPLSQTDDQFSYPRLFAPSLLHQHHNHPKTHTKWPSSPPSPPSKPPTFPSAPTTETTSTTTAATPKAKTKIPTPTPHPHQPSTSSAAARNTTPHPPPPSQEKERWCLGIYPGSCISCSCWCTRRRLYTGRMCRRRLWCWILLMVSSGANYLKSFKDGGFFLGRELDRGC